MIIRIWRTEIATTHMVEYEQFAQERSLPMFRQQQGFLGVLFLGRQKDRAVLTIWKDISCVEALAQSPSYQETSAQLSATGFLVGPTSVEVFEAQSGSLDFQALVHVLENTNKQYAGERRGEQHGLHPVYRTTEQVNSSNDVK